MFYRQRVQIAALNSATHCCLADDHWTMNTVRVLAIVELVSVGAVFTVITADGSEVVYDFIGLPTN